MGKGDIRTRRGKIWRRTYGVTRPRRWKTVVRPAATTRKVKTLKDLPKAVAEPIIRKPVVEATAPVIEKVQPVENVTTHVRQTVAEPVSEVTSKAAPKKAKPAAKKVSAAKKVPAAKKAPAKKKK